MGAAAEDSRAGELLGRYQLVEVLDSDGTSDAYLATDSQSASQVTIKVLRPEFALQSSVVQQFVAGPRTLSGLTHPNVSRVLAVESDDTGIPYVVEERVSGQPLSQMLASFPGGMPLGVAMNVLLPIVEALDAAHAQGIVHGHLGTDTVLLAVVEGTTVPKILGFGLTTEAGAASASLRAPELAQGGAPDRRSDMWSLGALFYETLSGEAPAGSTGDRGQPDLDDLAPHLPSALTSLVGQCLNRDPASRVESDALCMQLQSLRRKLGGGGKPTATAARPVNAPGAPRVALRREPTGPVEAPVPGAAASAATTRVRSKARPDTPFDPFARKASPSIAPASSEGLPGLPPMRPPSVGIDPHGHAARQQDTAPVKIDGLPSMRPPELVESVKPAPKLRTGILERIPTPLPPIPPPAVGRAAPEPAPDPAPSAHVDSEESSFADISLDETAPGADDGAFDDASFADLTLDDEHDERDDAKGDDGDSAIDAALDNALGDTLAGSLADDASFADLTIDDDDEAPGGVRADDDASFADLSLDDTAFGASAPSGTADMGLDATMAGSVADAVGALDDDEGPEVQLDDEDDDVEISYDDDPDVAESDFNDDAAEEDGADAPEVKTLDALASAFGPLDGEDRIGQGEAPSAARVRKFREELGDETKPAVPAVFLERSRQAEKEEQIRREAAAKARENKGKVVKDGVPISRKQLREGVRRVGNAVTAEQLRNIREVTKDEDGPLKRMVGALLLLVFAVALLYAMPLLVDPTRVKAYAVFGAKTKLAGAGLSVLSVISLIRMWSIQLHTKPPMIKPVTMTMKVVTACICVCGISYFLPRGALGPVEYGARMALPWAGGLFYLFLALYGLGSALREAANNVLIALMMGALYSGALFGSYKVVMTNIVAGILAEKARAAERARDDEDGDADDHSVHEGTLDRQDLANKVTGQGRDATKGVKVGERKLVGASEADDMQAIEEMRNTRKSNAAEAGNVNEKLPELMR